MFYSKWRSQFCIEKVRKHFLVDNNDLTEKISTFSLPRRKIYEDYSRSSREANIKTSDLDKPTFRIAIRVAMMETPNTCHLTTNSEASKLCNPIGANV